MPVAPTYPGVYIEEIPSGVRTIIGVGTSITAFVGRTQRGPTDEAITITSYADFERIYGGLWVGSRLGFAVRDFYLNGGSLGVIVRLFHPTFATPADQRAKAEEATKHATRTADAIILKMKEAAQPTGGNAATRDSVIKAATDLITAAAPWPTEVEGTTEVWSDIDKWTAARIITKVNEKTPQNSTAEAPTVQQTITDAEAGQAEAILDAPSRFAPSTHAQITIDLDGDATGTDALKLYAAYQGTWGNELIVRIDHDALPETAEILGLTDTSGIFSISIHDPTSGDTEVIHNVTLIESIRRIDKVLAQESRLMRAETPVLTPGSTITRPEASATPITGVWFLIEEDDNQNYYLVVTADASDGALLDIDDFTGVGKQAAKAGLYALDKADLFNLLVIPPYKPAGDDFDIDYSSLVDSAVAYCEQRRALFLIDPPVAWNSKQAALDGISGRGTGIGPARKNAAVFFPRIRQPNPLRGNQIEDFVPSGAIAGLFARTDTQRGVWKAPAGLDAILLGVPELKVGLTDLEIGQLNQLAVNCLRTMQPVGRVVWGSRTRVGDDRLASEWKYIPIRRLALYIEETLYRATHWVVFEPNDEPLWAQIRLNVGAFMQNLFLQGAFQGRSPRDAYFVKCDKDTTTQNHINMGIVNIIVGFAPLKPAEFVIIKLQQMAGQIAV